MSIENVMAPEINVRMPSKALVNTLVRSSLEAGFLVNVLFDTINNRQSYLGVKSVIRMWYVLKIQCLWVQVETSRVGITDAVPASLLLLVDVDINKKQY